MPRTFISIFLIIPITMLVVEMFSGQPVTATSQPPTSVPTFAYATSAVPAVSANAFYALDVASGQPLAMLNADQQLPIASITKLITSALFYSTYLETSAASESAVITVTNDDVAGMGRAGALAAGEQYPLSILNFPALLTSANAASALMARSGSGDLLDRVNEYAAANGFRSTKLADAHGLSAANVSTAAELAAWFTHISEVAPTVRDITRLKQYIYDSNGWLNNSPFISDVRYQGGKHGYTDAAGRTVVASFLEPITGGQDREVVYVLLGSSDLVSDMAVLRRHVQDNAYYQ